MSAIDRIRAKITRAKQHIQDFQLALGAFYGSGPYAVAVKEDAQRGKRIYYVAKIDDVPDALTAIAADVIQNLRSPLDQIAYQLVIADGGPKTEKVYYPIRDLAAHYPSARGAIAKHVRQEVIDAIDATEPYKGGKGHALWQLNALNNPDKHQLLIGAATFTTGFDISVLATEEFASMDGDFSGWPYDPRKVVVPPFFLKETRTVPLHVGDELFIEPIDMKVTQQRRFAFDVSLNAPGVVDPEPALKTLQDFSNLVDGIVTELGRFLPS